MDETVEKKLNRSEQKRKEADQFFLEKNIPLAVFLYQKSLKNFPDNIKTMNNLAVLYEETGQLEKACALYKKACTKAEELNCASSSYYENLARAYALNNKKNASLWAYHAALTTANPVSHVLANNYLLALKTVQPDSYDSAITTHLELISETSDMDVQLFADVYLTQLSLYLKSKTNCKNAPLTHLKIIEQSALTLKLIHNQLVTLPYLESTLILIRKTLCGEILADKVKEPHNQFLDALRAQCALNGQIYHIDEEELAFLVKLRTHAMEDKFNNTTKYDAEILLAIYDDWLTINTPNTSSFITTESTEYNHKEIASLSQSVGPREVKTFYEANPYPTWNSKPYYIKSSVDEYLDSIGATTRRETSERDYILVAGCGTGRHAIQMALSYPDAIVFGLDVSLPSLKYAREKSAELRVKNIIFIQGSLLDIHKFNIKFQIIECIGVLHHLENPTDGCKALFSVLKTHGVIKLGLYSKAARHSLSHLASSAELHGIDFKPFNLTLIREFAKTSEIFQSTKNIINSHDFYSRSGCMDLLFNPLEKCFTIETIFELIKLCNADFAGFEPTTEYSSPVFRSFSSDIPIHSVLEKWDTFEKYNPEFFSGMYLFWLRQGQKFL